MRIRSFNKEEFPEIQRWWNAHGLVAPTSDEFYPEQSSFVVEISGKPVLAVALFLTNAPVVWIENFVSNPDIDLPDRKIASAKLLNHIKMFSKDLGYELLFCMAPNPILARYYSELGFGHTRSNIETFLMEAK